jgi:class 3 adenylate cyclase
MNPGGTDLRPSSVRRAFDRIAAVAASEASPSRATRIIGAQIARALSAEGQGAVATAFARGPHTPPAALRLSLDAGGPPADTLLLPPRRCGRPYTVGEVRVARLLASQGARALDQVRTRHALAVARDQLAAALRRVEELESIRTALARFVPRTVCSVIEDGRGAAKLNRRTADVSVLFVDIVGYTRLAERLEPERVAILVERCFGAVLDEVLARGGDVNETSGDGLMVIFESEEPRSHARAAVEAGLAILGRVRAINREPGVEPIALHLGVNSGPATVGVRRIEGRAGTRWTYTATGPVTNLAARLADLSGGDAVIAGAPTRDRLALEYPFEDVGRLRLRNLDRAVQVWRLSPAAPGRSDDPTGAVGAVGESVSRPSSAPRGPATVKEISHVGVVSI